MGFEIEPAKICFAFNPDEKEGNKSINHKLNIETSARAEMEKQGIQQLEIAFILLRIKNYGVVDFSYKTITLSATSDKGTSNG
jgi:hypothetical protein